MKVSSLKYKFKTSPFINIAVLFIVFILLSVVFRDEFAQYSSPEHDFELELEKLSPQVREPLRNSQAEMQKAVIAFNRNDLDKEERQYLVSKHLRNAIAEAEKASTIEPNNPLVWIVRATLYKSIMDITNDADTYSITMYKKAIELDPRNPDYHFELARLYFILKKFDDAISEFSLAAQLDPNDGNIYYNLGIAYKEKGDKTKAKATLEKAMKLSVNTSTLNKEEIQKLLESL